MIQRPLPRLIFSVFIVTSTVLTACVPAPLFVAKESMRQVNQLTYLGVDFSHAGFADPWFTEERLYKRVYKWSEQTMKVEHKYFDFFITSDLKISDRRNEEIRDSDIRAWPAMLEPFNLTTETVEAEVRPYLKKGAGVALLIVVEDMVKKYGIAAHYIVFNRGTGEILLTDQIIEKPRGFIPHIAYLKALRKVARHARKVINAHR